MKISLQIGICVIAAATLSACDTTVASAGRGPGLSETHTVALESPRAGVVLSSLFYNISGTCDPEGDPIDLLLSTGGSELNLIASVTCADDSTYEYDFADPGAYGARVLRAAQVDSDGKNLLSSDIAFSIKNNPNNPVTPTQPMLGVLSTAAKPVSYSTNSKIDLGSVLVGSSAQATVDFKNTGPTALTLTKASNNGSVSISGFPASLAPGATARATFIFDTSSAATLATKYTFHYANSASGKDFVLNFAAMVKTTLTPGGNGNGGGTSGDGASGGGGGTTNPVAPGSLTAGINWNIGSDIGDIDYATLVDTAVRDLGLKSIRMYMSVNFGRGSGWINIDANAAKLAANMKVARLFRLKGVHVTFVVAAPEGDDQTPDTLPPPLKKGNTTYSNYEQAKAAGAVASNVCDILKAMYNNGGSSYINLWEIGNEVNLPNYWNRGSGDGGRVADYIETYLKPAGDCLHGLNAKVQVSTAGFTSTVENSIKLVTDHGGFNYANVAAFHLYREKSGSNHVSSYSNAFAAVRNALPADKKNIPLAVTEWSGFNGTTGNYKGAHQLTANEAADWADYNDEIWQVIKANASIAHYFTVLYNPDMAHGKCSAYQMRNNSDGTRAHNAAGNRIFDRTPYFYNSISSWGN